MTKYCLDTNVLIQAWVKYYSMRLCPDYWSNLDALAQKGVVFCPMEVRKEIDKTDDELSECVKSRPHFFVEPDAVVQKDLIDILAKFPRLVDSTKQRSVADPWVIAHAKATSAIVVTKEEVTNSRKRIKIPDVCKALGIQCMDDFQFLNEIGVSFSINVKP